ncbi:hypothetical protein CSUI_004789 [Cystoisospora suis]|uniref:Transmembrane protein n=1 Tax=Cystoisospora suis TaxID=483139 RepID=A0A2C6KZ84_9APIC|nr:hypothetical protein CSUI_004789 [Cystoisospora suis]
MEDRSFQQVATLATVASSVVLLALCSVASALENEVFTAYCSLRGNFGKRFGLDSKTLPEEKRGDSLAHQQSQGTAVQGSSAGRSSSSPTRRRWRSSTWWNHIWSPASSLGGLSGPTVKLLVALTVFAAAVLVFYRLGAILAKCLEHTEPLNQAGSSPRLLSGLGRRNDDCELGETTGPGDYWVATLSTVGVVLTGFAAYYVLIYAQTVFVLSISCPSFSLAA